jgi:hypothetical protein
MTTNKCKIAHTKTKINKSKTTHTKKQEVQDPWSFTKLRHLENMWTNRITLGKLGQGTPLFTWRKWWAWCAPPCIKYDRVLSFPLFSFYNLHTQTTTTNRSKAAHKTIMNRSKAAHKTTMNRSKTMHTQKQEALETWNH